MPWTYTEGPPDQADSKDHIRPRTPKWKPKKADRIENIKQQLEKIEATTYSYRKEKINSRRMVGLDNFVKEFAPGWMKASRADEDVSGMGKKKSIVIDEGSTFDTKRKKGRR